MGFVDSLMKFLNDGWEEIAVGADTTRVPRWVLRAYYRKRNPRHPYGVFYIRGKHFAYKVELRDDVQGGSFHVYRRLKKRISFDFLSN